MWRSQRFSWAQGLVFGSIFGLALGGLGARADVPVARRGLSRFAEVLALVGSEYVDPTDSDRLLEGGIRGLVATLDPHSTYFDAEELAVFESHAEGRFVGIGVEVQIRDGWLVIGTVFPDGPAARAGMRAGDRILEIDGQIARDLQIDDAVRKMRGVAGSVVELALRRDGAEDAVRVRLERAPVVIHAVESRVLADDVIYVRIRTFQESTAEELRRALDEGVEATHARQGVRGVILDLRENGGGLLRQAVDVVDEFVEEGVIVTTRGRDGALLAEARARRLGTRPDWPLVVLVDGFSASASEVVAGALRDHRRAVLVGTRTFGKGSVQSIVPLTGGGGIKLTIGRFYTPLGRSIQAQGIEPDVVVDRVSAEALATARAARPTITEGSTPRHLGPGELPGAPEVSSFDLFPDDYQAAMAHQTLRATAVRSRESGGGR